jgi:hypothetical protein
MAIFIIRQLKKGVGRIGGECFWIEIVNITTRRYMDGGFSAIP